MFTDIAGPMPLHISVDKYVQSFIDGCARLKYIYLLKKNPYTGGALRDFIVKFEPYLTPGSTSRTCNVDDSDCLICK
jgi:hypothetical protein